jgi:serine/threonine protein kinase
MPVDPRRVQEVFLEAAQHQGADRAVILDRECAGDRELRERVELLLRAHDEPDEFLDWPIVGRSGMAVTRPDGEAEIDPDGDSSIDRPVAPPGESGPGPTASSTDSPPITEGPGNRIGPYKLLQKVGEGGMGVVFMAEQEDPVRRLVALKIIRRGMDSEQVIARYEAERQALAMMDHPNIARVLDAGTTDAGRPFFVMELVQGVSITEFCNGNRLTTRERLELFIPVSQAIQHAHQKGIIHRDIKPSNVMITLYDGKPAAKVIDFGVAKAVEQAFTDRSMFTQFGTVMGTFEYMSPEQAEMDAPGVDTRSDVYSLGVLLYELLTGTTPLERRKLMGMVYVEILRRIREENPPRPSSRLKASKDTLVAIAAQSKTEPERLTKLIRGELDWIVMKAIEKDRTRRYETASALCRDIRHYLDGVVVEACPPSAAYLMKKFAWRNRASLATVVSFAVLLVVGAMLSVRQAIRATEAEAAAIRQAERAKRAEERSSLERDRALAAEAQARAVSEKAEGAAAEARAVLSFFQDRVLSAARPEGLEGGLGKDATIRKAIDGAEPKIAAAFSNQPRTEASIRSVLGDTYYYLGEPAIAARQGERALELRTAELGPDHPDTLNLQNSLALAYWAAGQHGRAIPLLERAAEVRSARLGAEHPDTLATQNNLAIAYQAAGVVDRAIPLLERTAAACSSRLGAGHPDTLAAQNNLANAYRVAGRLEQALPLSERTVAAQAARLGADHPATITGRNILANVYRDTGQNERAIPILEQTLAVGTAKLGFDHLRVLITRSILASAYLSAGWPDRSIRLLEGTAAAQAARLGADHPDTLASRTSLANAYREAGRNDLAIPMLEQTLTTQTARLGAEHVGTLVTRKSLARSYGYAGWSDRSIRLLEGTAAAQAARLGADHPDTLATQNDLAVAYREAGQHGRAILLLERTLAMRKAKLGIDHPGTLTTRSHLAEAYEAGGDPTRAETLFRDVLAARKKKPYARHPEVAEALSALGRNLLNARQWAEAEPLLREALAIWDARRPDDWNRFHTRSLLGESLWGRGKYAEAEPLLLSGYEGMKARESSLPASRKISLTEAGKRNLRLYESWGKSRESETWRARLATLNLERRNLQSQVASAPKSFGCGGRP